MRKIIGAVFVSLDGVMQAPGGPDEDTSGGFRLGGWLAPLFDETSGEAVDNLFKEPFDLLLGRRTYDIFAAYWPYATGESKPMAIVASLKDELGLGHGHAMAVVALLKGLKKEGDA